MTVAGSSLSSYRLRLYVAGQSPRSLAAVKNLNRLVRVVGRCRIEIVDLLAYPEHALRDQIIAIPTLVKRWPLPPLRVVGDLSDMEYVVAGLELHTVQEDA